MNDTNHDGDPDFGDVGPGYMETVDGGIRAGIQGYVLGLFLAALLTAAAFYIEGTHLIWGPGIAVALIVLAVAQIGVHLVFFLHITTAPDNTNNILALAFGVLIVALIFVGSVWIMAHLNDNLMPMHGAVPMQP
ncbi:MAG TPA: cytochrome o ubiquinol oxidase subunit IV [Acetobacteraceae bacterium]|jgi:cytochrome o ubiquinol oxidase subunit IV|nr:cytochrome o ubiquinol oxidase subunit IV [Acetobacteraceae bacterium]